MGTLRTEILTQFINKALAKINLRGLFVDDFDANSSKLQDIL
ncbi:hypothetical protein NIES2104_57410 [Leptolyngbya sp. NIES-2104]|nr:hypothetical protein NIES2104_57410 [Leptolyngbya sp. NIES-2104]